MKIALVCNRVIEYSFYLLFFLVPLILTPLNYELFEYNKMMLTYALTIIILCAWLVKMITSRQFIFKRTPLDIPLIIFFLSQVLSFMFSLDRHTSFWGYYSRFHGGLASTLSYIFLYYGFVSNMDKKKVLGCLFWSLVSAFLVASYGIGQHFGIDAHVWVQDVKNRVFSTLGQPNWLAAYLAILIPIAVAFTINPKSKAPNPNFACLPARQKFRIFIYYLLSRYARVAILYCVFTIYYLCLLYTKSRSGFAGFWIANILFWGSLLILDKINRSAFFVFRNFLIINSLFLILTFISGAPFAQINRFTAQELFRPKAREATQPAKPTSPALEIGGTESGEIRKIVWKGAWEIAKHYPLFGSGLETFAYSYYQFRPKEHNLTSEWDYLYNKAHNEYLNYAATTGIIGLGSYLLLIGTFIFWSLKKFTIKKNQNYTLIIHCALLAGFASILVTNFFGFSVVPIAIYFYLIPAMSFIIKGTIEPETKKQEKEKEITKKQGIFILIIVFTSLFLVGRLAAMWWADVAFSSGNSFDKAGQYNSGYQYLKKAVELNPYEPLYHDELSYNAAILAVGATQQKESTLSARLLDESLFHSQKAIKVSPKNVNFWKTRTRVFYVLSTLEEKYNQKALEALKEGQKLAPTDAKIAYNLGLLYGRLGNNQMAIKTLEETIRLKPNYQDLKFAKEVRYALALFYKENGRSPEAVALLEEILSKIDPSDAQSQEKLEEWQKK